MGYCWEFSTRVGALAYSAVSFVILTLEYSGPIEAYQHKRIYEIYKVVNTTIDDEWYLTYTRKKLEKDWETKKIQTDFILVREDYEI